MLENKWKKTKLFPRLRKISNCEFFTKEARSISGIPDIIGCINGRFFALEVKRSEKSKRSALQEYFIKNYNIVGGYCMFVYPENLERVIAELELLSI